MGWSLLSGEPGKYKDGVEYFVRIDLVRIKMTLSKLSGGPVKET